MYDEKPTVGGDVDGFCSRCKLDLAHTVVAMVGSRVVQVICNTCGSHHRYRAPQAAPEPSGAVHKVLIKRGDHVIEKTTLTKTGAPSRPPAKISATAPKRTAKAPSARSRAAANVMLGFEQTWSEQINAHAGMPVRLYRMSEQFDKGDVLQHAAFGVGIVQQRSEDTKITVLFRNGFRTLAMNRPSVGA